MISYGQAPCDMPVFSFYEPPTSGLLGFLRKNKNKPDDTTTSFNKVYEHLKSEGFENPFAARKTGSSKHGLGMTKESDNIIFIGPAGDTTYTSYTKDLNSDTVYEVMNTARDVSRQIEKITGRKVLPQGYITVTYANPEQASTDTLEDEWISLLAKAVTNSIDNDECIETVKGRNNTYTDALLEFMTPKEVKSIIRDNRCLESAIGYGTYDNSTGTWDTQLPTFYFITTHLRDFEMLPL